MRQMTRVLGGTIRSIREERGLSRAALAKRCGISLRHMASIEAGANFSIAIFLAILQELPDPTLLTAFSRLRDESESTPCPQNSRSSAPSG